MFLHYFDIHFLDLKGVGKEAAGMREHIEAECRLATRFAILCADEVLVPAASFFESPLCYRVIHELRDLYPCGCLKLLGGGLNIPEYAEDKLRQYQKGTPQYKRYRALVKKVNEHPPFFGRENSATDDIAAGWLMASEAGHIARVTDAPGVVLPQDFEARWQAVPERLDGKAFIVDYVEPLLADSEGPSTFRNRLHAVINEQYFASFTREYSAGVVTDLGYLAAPHTVPSYGVDISFKHLREHARQLGLLARVEASTGKQLMDLRDESRWTEVAGASSVAHDTELMMRSVGMQSQQLRLLSSATIGIITALPREFAAVCEVLGCGGPIDVPGQGAGRKYALAHISAEGGGEHVVAVCLLTAMGNNSAAIRATLLLEHCKGVRHIFMVGIAGAVPNPKNPEEHVRLGDIVVSGLGGVVQYDLDKESPTEVEHRHAPRPPASTVIDALRWLQADELRGRRPWEAYIDTYISSLGTTWERPPDEADILDDGPDGVAPCQHPNDPARREGRPRVFEGVIGSANKLLRNPVKRDYLRDEFSVKAVEMEGAGVADASWVMDHTGYFVVRGTCDYCNPRKGDTWQNYAAVIAACYARSLIEQTPAREQ